MNNCLLQWPGEEEASFHERVQVLLVVGIRITHYLLNDSVNAIAHVSIVNTVDDIQMLFQEMHYSW